MLQFASQLVEAALTTAKQLWGTKTINTDSLLHPEPTCSLLRVPHREATPTSTIAITVLVRTQRHRHMQKTHSSHAPHPNVLPSHAGDLPSHPSKTASIFHLAYWWNSDFFTSIYARKIYESFSRTKSASHMAPVTAERCSRLAPTSRITAQLANQTIKRTPDTQIPLSHLGYTLWLLFFILLCCWCTHVHTQGPFDACVRREVEV